MTSNLLHENKFSDKSDGSELSEEETEKMQKDELDTCKAWGSLWIPTKEAPWHLLKRNKAKQDKTANQLTQLMEDFFCTADN
jgi:hypothetical protein